MGTARLLDLGPVATTRDIMNMRIVARFGGRDAMIRRAQRILAQPAPEGANVVIVGHGNLMRAATGGNTSEAGSGVYAPRAGSEPGFELVALLAPDDWMRLAELVGRTADFGGVVPSQQVGAVQERSSGDRFGRAHQGTTSHRPRNRAHR
jgi:hypothetical protein